MISDEIQVVLHLVEYSWMKFDFESVFHPDWIQVILHLFRVHHVTMFVVYQAVSIEKVNQETYLHSHFYRHFQQVN